MNTGHPTGKIIDLALGMERLNTTQEGSALEALRILFEMLKPDIAALQAAEEKNDIKAAYALLIRTQCGLKYSGTPRLEQACNLLCDAVKRAKDLKKVEPLFWLFYDEVKLFGDEFKAMIKEPNRNG
jgi:hypothetical protein